MTMCSLRPWWPHALPRRRAARLLTLGKPHLEQDAMRALDWALGALPGEA